MLSLKELRHRKKTTLSILRMTQAMKMIAQAKFYREKNRLREVKDGHSLMMNVAFRLVCSLREQKVHLKSFDVFSPIEDASKPWVVVVMTSNNGLCGNFNQNLIREAETYCAEQTGPIQIFCLGKKGEAAFARHKDLLLAHDPEDPCLMLHLLKAFKRKKIRGCTVISGHFHNILRQEVKKTLWLPFALPEPSQKTPLPILSCDPTLKVVFQNVMDQLLINTFRSLHLEHLICEHAARMAAMEGACENSKTMAQALQKKQNNLRQHLITKELSEIISGAESL